MDHLLLFVSGAGFCLVSAMAVFHWRHKQAVSQVDESHRAQIVHQLEYFDRQVCGELDSVLSRMVVEFPLPLWCKDYRDNSGTMLFMSEECGRVWGVDTAQLVGHTDDEYWPAEIAAEARRRDLEVLASGRGLVELEKTPGIVPAGWASLRVYKWMVLCDSERGLIFGLGVPTND